MNPGPVLDYSLQPYQGTDIIALVLALVAVLCGVIRWRDRERGMGWFAVAMASMALWVAFNERHLPTSAQLNPSAWWLVMCLSQAAMAPGLVAYLGVPARLRWRVMLPILLPSLAFAGVSVGVTLTGASVARIWLHAFTAIAMAAMGLLALWAHRREPDAGHAWLAAVFLAFPVLAALMGATGVDPVALRYWGVMLVMLVGLALPAVSLVRRRRALIAEVARRREAEQSLERANRSLEQRVAQRTAELQDMVAGLASFNRSVSHDLRGPLGGIAQLARLAEQALQQGDSAAAARALPAIAGQAEASAGLVNSLLELARVGEVAVARQRVDPERIAQDAIEQLRLAGTSDLPRIVVHPLPAVVADPMLLHAVYANLIGNAVKFSAGRGPEGQVDIGASALDDGVVLYVSDNGVGFDAGQAKALFEPFHRLHDAGFDGHGVGLSIVRRAIDRLGGSVWAESTPGQGARFMFKLPAAA